MAKDLTRSQRKKLGSARKVVGASTEIVGYWSGKGHTRAAKALLYLGIGYAVAFVAVQILLGRFLIPGVLLIVAVYYLVRPLRGIAVTPVGVLVLHESMMNGQPSRVLFVAPPGALGPLDEHLEGKRHVRVQIGSELIRLKRDDYQSLLLATQNLPSRCGPDAVSPSAGLSPPGWFADPSSRFHLRYWDGKGWTEHVSLNGIVYSDSPA
jgi:hypothetical protein